MEAIFLTCLVISYFLTKGKVDSKAYENGKEPPGVAKARMRYENGGAARNPASGRPKGKGAFRLLLASRWANACKAAEDRGNLKAESRRAWYADQVQKKPDHDQAWRTKQLRRMAKSDEGRGKWARRFGLTDVNERRARQDEQDWLQQQGANAAAPPTSGSQAPATPGAASPTAPPPVARPSNAPTPAAPGAGVSPTAAATPPPVTRLPKAPNPGLLALAAAAAAGPALSSIAGYLDPEERSVAQSSWNPVAGEPTRKMAATVGQRVAAGLASGALASTATEAAFPLTAAQQATYDAMRQTIKNEPGHRDVTNKEYFNLPVAARAELLDMARERPECRLFARPGTEDVEGLALLQEMRGGDLDITDIYKSHLDPDTPPQLQKLKEKELADAAAATTAHVDPTSGFTLPKAEVCPCGSVLLPVPGTVHADEGDGDASVDTKCTNPNCNIQSNQSWPLSDEEFRKHFGHAYGADDEEAEVAPAAPAPPAAVTPPKNTPAAPEGSNMYATAVLQLTNAAAQVDAYRANLSAMAGGLEGKKWGVEVHGTIREMDADLLSAASTYRDLAIQMSQEGDAVSDAHDAHPHVPTDPDVIFA